MADGTITFPERPGVPANQTLPFNGTLPAPFRNIRVSVSGSGTGSDIRFYFEYQGKTDELIAAGCITDELIKRRGKGGSRTLDDSGDQYSIYTRKGTTRIKVQWRKPIERAADMPGHEPWMTDALHAKNSEHLRWQQEYKKISEQPEAMSPEQWRDNRNKKIYMEFQVLADLGDPSKGFMGQLDPSFCANTDDVSRFQAACDRAANDLAAIIRSMRIHRARGNLRIV